MHLKYVRGSQLVIVFCLFLRGFVVDAQKLSKNYLALQEKLCKGWNTWSYQSMLTQVLLPEGLAISLNFRQSFIGTPGASDFFLDEAVVNKSRLIVPVAHTTDGSYTELVINNWHGNSIRVQSAAINNQIYILVTPIESSPDIHYHVELEAGMLWNHTGSFSKKNAVIVAKTKGREFAIRSTGKPLDVYQPYFSPYLVLKGDTTIAFYTGSEKSLGEIKSIVNVAKENYDANARVYGSLSESFKAIQSVLGWNTIYDPEKKRVITPVSRAWNKAWQGFVLFEWDTFFASYLFGLHSRDMAYSNAIAVTKGINELGHLGHWQMPDGKTAIGMSQPPVGSMICWKLYEKFHDKWFLQEVYSELLTWNRWWNENRNNGGKLSWGGWSGAGPQIAAWESGMDNSPMYDQAKMQDTGRYALQNIWDVGLNALYVNDCQYLAKMATVLNRSEENDELKQRALYYKHSVLELWNDSASIYLNHYTDSNAFSYRLSPTLFYPMIAGIPSKKQVERMVGEHFYNPHEFYSELMLPSISFNDKDYNNDYWRGSIWPPLNFIVYLGLRDYNPNAAKELALKSYHLFNQAWLEHQSIFENINSDKGIAKTSGQSNSDPYYHWGALMAIMQFMEENKY